MRIEEVGLREAPEELLRELHAAGQVIHDEATPEDPRQPVEELLIQLRNLPPIIDGAVLVARGEAGLQGWANVFTQDIEGMRHVANVELAVLPEHRRQGVATALTGRAAAVADRLRRDLLMGSSRESVPAAEAFARSLGADLGQVNRESRLDLQALDRELVRRWLEEGPRRAPGYSLRFVRGETPDEIIDEAVAIFQVMNTAPKDDLDRRDIQITPELLRMQEKMGAEVGLERWAYYAVEDATGKFAGFTDVTVRASDLERVNQGNTAVDPAHRGHALGKWLKAAMAQKILDDVPEARWIITGNAFSNAPMLGINDEMGFKASAALQVWQVPVERLKTKLSAF